MPTRLKQALNHLNFSHQFLLAIIMVLVTGMTAIGIWIGQEIETSEVNRTAAIAAIYVESIISAQLRGWPNVGALSEESHIELDSLFVEGPLSKKVLSFKLWDSSGRIVYSTDHAQLGQRFPIKGRLAAAFAGSLQARVSDLDEADNLPERAHWHRLLEVYVPARVGNHGKIISVAEFYLSMENLDQDIRNAQLSSWAVVAGVTVVIYLLLFGMVRHASNTINDQQRDLRHQLQQLRTALDENDLMREQLREAGISTTTLNEEFLIRIAADLHDGPAQTIAFALLRFEEFAAACRGCASPPSEATKELRSINSALQSSLKDIRKISSGLAVPGIDQLSLTDTARRAVHDFEHISGQTIQTEIDEALNNAPLSVKITVYRLIQESLTNCRRHAPGGAPKVLVQQTDKQVLIEITDHGAGFDPQAAALAGRLGLAFMRERVLLLGGVFEVISAPGQGTRIRARLPLSIEEMIHV